MLINVSKSPNFPTTRHKPAQPKINVRDWSPENTDKLICALETTDWATLTSDQPNVNKQAEIITDYISFTFNECVPVTEKVVKPDKAWMNGKINKLLTARHYALSHHLNHQLPQLKSKLQCAIRRAKRKYAANVEQSLKSTNSRQSWKQLKSLFKMNRPTS